MGKFSFRSSVAMAWVATSLLAAGCTPAESEGGGAKSASGSESSGDHPLIGKAAPTFSVERIDGKGKIDLKKLSGKVVLVDFWATWCEPCKKSFPKLQELATKYGANGFEVVGISVDDEKGGIAEFGTTHGAKFPLGWDKDKGIAEQWTPKSMPSSYLVDRKGTVRFVHLGYHAGEEVELEKEIKELL